MAKIKNKLKRMNAPVYRYWAALCLSFYSKNLYVDVGKRWRGLGLLYLLFALALFSIPFALKVSAQFNHFFNQQLIEPLSQLPDIYIQNGAVSFDKPMPYLIKNKNDQVIVIVDTTGTIEQFTNQYPYLNILINKHTIYFKIPTPQLFDIAQQPINPGIPIAQPIAKNANMVFNGKKIIEDSTIIGLKYASQLMIYPIVVTLLFSILLVALLIFALLGQAFSRIFFSFPVTFLQASRLLMVSSTPIVLILIVFLSINSVFPGLGIILLVILTAYFSFALYSLKSDSKRLAAS